MPRENINKQTFIVLKAAIARLAVLISDANNADSMDVTLAKLFAVTIRDRLTQINTYFATVDEQFYQYSKLLGEVVFQVEKHFPGILGADIDAYLTFFQNLEHPLSAADKSNALDLANQLGPENSGAEAVARLGVWQARKESGAAAVEFKHAAVPE
ncbi:MAG: hypothetical protein COB66_00510 [Coxiella sp. (in: Bacteria)]|nr:MAG: hypothetical protein COB66_00510 [Coxiella sp. (in: g-proteobacteria)]